MRASSIGLTAPGRRGRQASPAPETQWGGALSHPTPTLVLLGTTFPEREGLLRRNHFASFAAALFASFLHWLMNLWRSLP